MVLKNEFLVSQNYSSELYHPAVEKFGEGFIVVYYKAGRIYLIRYDGSYNPIDNSERELNTNYGEIQNLPWIE